MEDESELMPDDYVEVLVQTRGEEMKQDNNIQEAASSTAVRSEESSFETLIRTALALEEDPTDDHSYAYSDKKQAFFGKEKDHSYSSYSKMAHRKVQSLSDENLYRSSDTSDFLDDFALILPHYQSKDSALDITGFDTISEKCLSFDNINVKTVDVVTDKCILPGLSDPDISKMTIRNEENAETSSSLPNSPPFKDQRLTIEHNYFKGTKTKIPRGTLDNQTSTNDTVQGANLSKEQRKNKKATLQDHSYYVKPSPLLARLKRGRSSDKINSYEGCMTKDFVKSPFLDQTYQSFDLKNLGKRQNIGQKLDCCTDSRQRKSLKCSNNVCEALKARLSQQLEHDHAYEPVLDSDVNDLRFRTSSMSETESPVSAELKTDHSYTIRNRPAVTDNTTQDKSQSDSGTESLDGDTDETKSLAFKSRNAKLDHTYVTKYMYCDPDPDTLCDKS